MSIWVLERWCEPIKEWRLSTPYEIFKHKERAERRLLTYAQWKHEYRIREYRSVA